MQQNYVFKKSLNTLKKFFFFLFLLGGGPLDTDIYWIGQTVLFKFFCWVLPTNLCKYTEVILTDQQHLIFVGAELVDGPTQNYYMQRVHLHLVCCLRCHLREPPLSCSPRNTTGTRWLIPPFVPACTSALSTATRITVAMATTWASV